MLTEQKRTGVIRKRYNKHRAHIKWSANREQKKGSAKLFGVRMIPIYKLIGNLFSITFSCKSVVFSLLFIASCDGEHRIWHFAPEMLARYHPGVIILFSTHCYTIQILRFVYFDTQPSWSWTNATSFLITFGCCLFFPSCSEDGDKNHRFSLIPVIVPCKTSNAFALLFSAALLHRWHFG